jgi:hypothetical protein
MLTLEASLVAVRARNKLTPSERTALAMHALEALKPGKFLTTDEVAALTGLRRRGAWDLLTRISRRVPLYCENDRWRMC